MQDKQLVILMAGKATRLAPLSYQLPKGLLTINHKPVIYNMLIDYIKKGLTDIIFVVSSGNKEIIESFVNKSFGNLKIRFVVQNSPQGPLQAFQLCNDFITKPVILLLGDTLCETDLDYSTDWLGYMNISDNSHSRWCLIKTDADENVQEVIDKPDYTPETNKVLVGIYNFADYIQLKESLSKTYDSLRGELQLSSLIEDYSSKRKMKGQQINFWSDTGTLQDYHNTFAKSISGRNFNSFHLDKYGVLTKTSRDPKVISEAEWLKKISQSSLGFLMPRIFSYKRDKDSVSYKMEWIDGLTLSEYFLYHDIGNSNWEYIMEKFLETIKLFWEKKAPKKEPDVTVLARKIYLDKTLERIEQWERKDILEKPYIHVNGVKLASFKTLYAKIVEGIEKLIKTSNNFYTIIHGDPCFSNVIYQPSISSFKFLDPRGNFGEDTIYGDYRYDLAKIRHSYHGLYDYITQGLYSFKEFSPTNFEYNFLTKNIVNPLIFDNIFIKQGFNINEIELIEGLLFLSMIPLHTEDKNAQIMYYIAALKCFNNCFDGVS